MNAIHRPPFDEDDVLDQRALYRTLPSGSPELDSAIRQRWQAGHTWHPAWAVAACIALLVSLFTWTNMREMANAPETPLVPLVSTSEDTTSADISTSLSTTVEPAPAVQAHLVAEPSATEHVPVMVKENVSADANTTTTPISPSEVENSLHQIRHLLQNDQEAEASQLLQTLKQQVPDLTVPDDLETLLPQSAN